MSFLFPRSKPSILAGALLAVLATPAAPQIMLSQPSFEVGAKFAAFFKVEHGCAGSPTVSLRISMPDGVAVLETPPKPGWKLAVERVKDRIVAVTWQGRLDPKVPDQFGLFLKLPEKLGILYFPTAQRCETGETKWTDIPAPGQAWRDVPHPAPMLQLVAATSPPMLMAGDVMITEPWSRATPPGATTGAAYLTLTNHGTAADTLTGVTSPLGQVQIHQMSNAGGISTMREIKGVAIAPGATVKITPDGGYHLMLVGLKAPLKEGAEIPLTLNFAKGGPLLVEFPVLKIGSQGPAGAAATPAMPNMPGMDHH